MTHGSKAEHKRQWDALLDLARVKAKEEALAFDKLGIESTLPLVSRPILSLESSWEFNVANEGQSSSIVFTAVLPLNTKLTNNLLNKNPY